MNVKNGFPTTVPSGGSTTLRASIHSGQQSSYAIYKDPSVPLQILTTIWSAPFHQKIINLVTSLGALYQGSWGYGSLFGPPSLLKPDGSPKGPPWGASLPASAITNYEFSTGPLTQTTTYRLVAGDYLAVNANFDSWFDNPPFAPFASADVTVNVAAAPTPVTTFTGTYGGQVNQTTLSLPAGGGNVNLNWSVTNATGGSCTGYSTTGIAGWAAGGTGGKAVSGTNVSVTVANTTRFDLDCWNSTGTPAIRQSVQVNVAAAGGTCGGADGHTFAVSDNNYTATYNQCASGVPDSTSFPPIGGNTSWRCSGSTNLCTAYRDWASPLPDLSAASVNLSTVTAGYPVTFLVKNINNQGAGDINVSFVNLFRKADTMTGSGAIDIGTDTVPHLRSGGNAPISLTYTFPLSDAGTYKYIKVCADKSSAADTGSIAEANEANNCSPWWEISVTADGAGKCGQAHGHTFLASDTGYTAVYDQCDSGVPSNTTFPSSATGNVTNWTCPGGLIGTNCTAYREIGSPALAFTGTYGAQVDQTTLNLPAGGGNVTFKWITNSDTIFCDAWGGDATWNSYNPASSGGSVTRNVSASRTYLMECWNAANVSTGVQQVQVNVAAASCLPCATSWSACSASCGGGTQTRMCPNPLNSCNPIQVSQACNVGACRDYNWKEVAP
jgi:hypothetical protein